MKKMKGFLSGFLSCAIITAMIGTAVAAAYTKNETLHFNGIKLKVNGEYISVTDSTGAPTEPFIINGTTYLPVGNVAKLVGYNVSWDGTTQTVSLDLPEEKKPTYITKTGSKYHNDPNCNGGTYWEVSLSTAIGMGFGPCSKCVHTDAADSVSINDTTEYTGEAYAIVNDNIPFFLQAN